MSNPVSSTNKTNRNDIAEILLKVALNTITIPPRYFKEFQLEEERKKNNMIK
jgi:hypothetical protein